MHPVLSTARAGVYRSVRSLPFAMRVCEGWGKAWREEEREELCASPTSSQPESVFPTRTELRCARLASRLFEFVFVRRFSRAAAGACLERWEG